MRIPGLPSTGAINLSMYLVGLYDFLLSIVGIVAVMMLIIGGMRYITAAGNAAAIGDAKDIIQNAIFGLLLALLSWVFVSTINPDVLYIKAPGSTFTAATVIDLDACYTSYTAPNCTCKNGNIVVASVDETTCNIDCKNDCKLTVPYPCVESNPVFFDDPVFEATGKCYCIDGMEVEPTPLALSSGSNCNEVCSDDTGTLAEDSLYHGLKIVVSVGDDITQMETLTYENNKIPELVATKDYFFDLSQSRDCKDGIVHFAMNLTGNPGLLNPVDAFCCRIINAGCPLLTWGVTCNPNLAALLCDNSQPIDGYPSPIHEASYVIGDVGPQQIWVGVSRHDAGCSTAEQLFDVEVIN
ncbi:MAG: hypothetical protein KAS05_04235 [Candidatus Omnitrophica bacterium]|nr:hypothetical protein [Candidatus Omnitrophota bacterium]